MPKDAILQEKQSVATRHDGDISLCIAEHVPVFCAGLRDILARDGTIRLSAYDTHAEAVLHSAQRYDPQVLLISMDLPPEGGLHVLRSLRRCGIEGKVVLYGRWNSCAQVLAAQYLGTTGMVSRNDPCEEFVSAIKYAAREMAFNSRSVRKDLERIQLRSDGNAGVGELTATEYHVLALLSGSRTSVEIADILSISVRTVEKHRQNIGHKLNLHGCNALLSFALNHASVLRPACE